MQENAKTIIEDSLKIGNQVVIIDGKSDFSKPNIFEQVSKIYKLQYKEIKKYCKFKNKSARF